MEKSPLLGLRTVIYAAPDLASQKAWFTEWLGFGPYFDEPFYVGFNVGGYELGLDPNQPFQPGSTTTYWGVASMAKAIDRLRNMNSPVSEPQDVGDGILVATVQDPVGNTIGLIENPHFHLPIN